MNPKQIRATFDDNKPSDDRNPDPDYKRNVKMTPRIQIPRKSKKNLNYSE